MAFWSRKPAAPVVKVEAAERQAGPFTELGATGLKRYGGYIEDEFVRDLRNTTQRHRFYREIRDNSPAIGGARFAIDNILCRVDLRVDAASDDPQDQEIAAFVQSCFEDMSQPFNVVKQQALSCLDYGWSYLETTYKRRKGDTRDGSTRSAFTDGRVGWRKMEIRAQESLDDWAFDDTGGVQGMWQRPAPSYQRIFIPIEKALLFRAGDHKGSPEGRSLLRNCVMPWKFIKRLQEIEAIGIERDLAGMPTMGVPPEVLSATSGDALTTLNACKDLVTNIRRDEQEGVLYPLLYDQHGNPRYKLELLASAGSRQIDASAVIQRYELRMLQSLLADFIFVGHEKVGSFSLSSDKTDLFALAIANILDGMVEVFNRFAIPRLLALNGWANVDMPKLCRGDIESPDLTALGDYVQKLAAAGLLLPSVDGSLESYLLRAANLPVPAEMTDEEVA
ncbi:MAG: hypothetical protein AB7I42_22995 [Bradyrhizobium sp.]|uniref:phage portal protein family protein n=1 Tax=Bradyrhizobium sp. TaxID=376 RepID=UPI003D1332F7